MANGAGTKGQQEFQPHGRMLPALEDWHWLYQVPGPPCSPARCQHAQFSKQLQLSLLTLAEIGVRRSHWAIFLL